MSTEARELHRIIRGSVRDMLDAHRLEAKAGPVSAQTLERIIFRAAGPIMDRLASFSPAERVGLLPGVLRFLLAAFLEHGASGGDPKTPRGPKGK
jgi:hypothetical protein